MHLPEEWELRESSKWPGRVYYYNNITHESTWIRPLPYPGMQKDVWPPLIAIHWMLFHTEEEAMKIWTKVVIEGETSGFLKNSQLSWVKTEEPFTRAVDLQIGELSQPIRSDDGYYIFLRIG